MSEGQRADDGVSIVRLSLVAFGFGAFVMVAVAITAQVSSSPKIDPSLITTAVPSIGNTARNGDWELTLHAFAPYEEYTTRPPSPAPQGKLMVISFSIANRGTMTSPINPSDFKIKSSDGRTFSSASRSLEKSLSVLQQVQPGLSTDNRLVFDLDPVARGLILAALGMQFRLS